MKYQKLPITVDALQWTGRNYDEADEFCEDVSYIHSVDRLYIRTLEGVMEALPNDWLIRGIAGEVYPCKHRIFIATYEPVIKSNGNCVVTSGD